MRLFFIHPGLARLEAAATLGGGGTELAHRRLEAAQLRGELQMLAVTAGEAEMAQAMAEALVSHGLGRLASQAADLPADFAHHVGHAREILVGQCELAQRFPPQALILGDAGGLLEHGPPLLRLGRQDLVDLALRHDRIARAPYPGVHEQLLDVLQAAGLAVEKVFAQAPPVHPAHDLDLVKLAAELLLAVGQEERRLAHLRRPAGIRALKDDILHLAAPQRLGALLAQHPADAVGDVRLPAAIGTHHRGHAGFEAEGRGVAEGFKAVKTERLEIHACSDMRESRARARK